MKTSEFYFDLPEELIAQNPSDKRGDSRLLVMDRNTGSMEHETIKNLHGLIDEGTLLVVNNSKVRKARLYGISDTGGNVEFLLTKQLDGSKWESIVSKKRKQRIGKRYSFPDNINGVISAIHESVCEINFSDHITDIWLDEFGHIPLPPYIKREDTEDDSERYQTVYAEKTGSSAAPTAGLHFTKALLEQMSLKKIETAKVTLHVGMGTFLPVRPGNVEDHVMHIEEYEINEENSEKINKAIQDKRKILAVGTTSVRTLESAWLEDNKGGRVISGKSSTGIYIYPGYRFKVVNHIITNFHTPDSSLILLVSAFAGSENIKAAYKEAIAQKYRFFSYGDAMLIK